MGSITKVRLSPDADVDDFRDAVKAKNADLEDISPRCLIVYRNKTAYDSKETQIKSSASMDGLGRDEEIALVVVVPNRKLQGIIDGVNGRIWKC